MVSMRVREQQCIEGRELIKRNAWSRDTRKYSAEPTVKVWISKNSRACDLQEERRMANIGDFHDLPSRTGRAIS